MGVLVFAVVRVEEILLILIQLEFLAQALHTRKARKVNTALCVARATRVEGKLGF